jgi:hypothetical protein
MQSIGGKSKGASSSSDLLRIKKQKVLANMYSQNDIKTRGNLSVTNIRQFKPDLNIFSQITQSGLVQDDGVTSFVLQASSPLNPILTNVTISSTNTLTVTVEGITGNRLNCVFLFKNVYYGTPNLNTLSATLTDGTLREVNGPLQYGVVGVYNNWSGYGLEIRDISSPTITMTLSFAGSPVSGTAVAAAGPPS